jgi:copper chaperone NosL
MKWRVLQIVLPLVAGAVFALGGCRREPALEPPAIVYGEDVCALCNMIVDAERFAAGAVVRQPDGRVSGVAYDDIGCLVEFARARPDHALLAVFVKDYETRQWLDARQAVFLHSETLHTPMASGLVALATPAAAGRVRQEHPGEILDYAAVLAGSAGTPQATAAAEGVHP